MESLMCCMAGRRHRRLANPLEGRVNLRLQGRQDYEDSLPLEPLDTPNCVQGSSSPSSPSRRNDGSPQGNQEVATHSNGLNGSAAKKQSENSTTAGCEVREARTWSSESTEILACAPPASFQSGPAEEGIESQPKQNGNREKPTKQSSRLDLPASADLPTSQNSMHEEKALQRELEELATRLKKTAGKYPSSGKTFFSSLKERHFAIQMGAGEAKARDTSLCYWEDEAESRKAEPLGMIPIGTIVDVEWKADVEKGLQVKVVTNTKDKKDTPIVLVLKFANVREAKSWSTDLQSFCESFRRWSGPGGASSFLVATVSSAISLKSPRTAHSPNASRSGGRHK